jgi:D-cysteine desulfhydrase
MWKGEKMILLDRLVYKNKKIVIVRDDLFPYYYGGNKARKMLEYERDIRFKGANALVTTGGIQSNHCRAVALMAAKNNWKCHIVYHGSKDRFYSENGNALLVRMTEAEVEFVTPDLISQRMDLAMNNYKEKGYNPYYITGGGHDIPGGMAYVKAIVELNSYLAPLNWKPNNIFFASGTGSTQSGLMVGAHLINWDDINIVGISVARNKLRGTDVINEFTERLSSFCGIRDKFNYKTIFIDDYVSGGYEKANISLDEMRLELSKSTGLITDSTYSGKAFYGMMDILEKSNNNGNILFWHTGGLLNIQK